MDPLLATNGELWIITAVVNDRNSTISIKKLFGDGVPYGNFLACFQYFLPSVNHPAISNERSRGRFRIFEKPVKMRVQHDSGITENQPICIHEAIQDRYGNKRITLEFLILIQLISGEKNFLTL